MTRQTPFRARLLRVFGVGSILAGITFGGMATAVANPTLDASSDLDCGTPDYDTGEEALADALDTAGYSCAALLNKGGLGAPKSYDQLGEAWFLNDNGTLRVRIFVFGDDNNDITEALKVCPDDDPDPINDILVLEGVQADEPTCTGDSAALKVAANAVPTHDQNAEEGAGLFEVLVESVTPIADGANPEDPGGWDIDINDFSEVVLHFNSSIENDDKSINAFFQAADTPDEEEDEDVTPALEADRPCGARNDHVDVPDPDGVTFKVGDAVVNGTTQQIPAAPASLVIVATADPGYQLTNADADTDPPSKTFTFSGDQDIECDEGGGGGGGGGGSTTSVDPQNPRALRQCGEVDQYVIPSKTGVTYKVDGVTTPAGSYDLPEGESVTITAHAKSGYRIPSNADDSWTFTGEPVEACPTTTTTTAPELAFTPLPAQVEAPPAPAVQPVLAFTGWNTMTTMLVALAMLMIGTICLAISKRELRVK